MADRAIQGVARRVVFKAYLASDHVTAATGKTIAVQISKNAAAFANPSAGATNATEIASGWYYVDLSTTDFGTAGPLVVRGTEGTIDPVEVVFSVDAPALGDVPALLVCTCPAGSTASTLKVVTTAPDVDNLFNGAKAVIISGTGAGQDARHVVSYLGSAGSFTCQITPDWVTTPDSTTRVMLIPCGRADIGLVKGGVTPTPTVTGQLKVNVNEWRDQVVPATAVSGVPKVDLTYSLGVAVLNEQFTLASATASTVTLPATYSGGGSIPDDDRYEWCEMAVVSGTGSDQIVMLTTAAAGARTYNVLSGTMPVQLDSTSKCEMIGRGAADVRGYGGVAGTFASGRPEVNTSHLAGTAYASADLSTTMKASVNAEVLDVMNVDTYAEPGQGSPAATTTLAAKINYLYKAWRNKKDQTSTTQKLYADDASTVDQKATVSSDGTTTTVGEMATGP